MESEILQIAVSLALTIAGYLAWKTYKKRDYLWLASIAGIALILKILDYILKTFFRLPVELDLIRSGVSLIILVLLIMLILKIAIWGAKNK